MCVFVCVCLLMFVNLYEFVYMIIRTCVWMYLCDSTCMLICVHMFCFLMRMWMYVRFNVCIYVCECCMCMCVWSCMNFCVFVRIFSCLCVHAFIYDFINLFYFISFMHILSVLPILCESMFVCLYILSVLPILCESMFVC